MSKIMKLPFLLPCIAALAAPGCSSQERAPVAPMGAESAGSAMDAAPKVAKMMPQSFGDQARGAPKGGSGGAPQPAKDDSNVTAAPKRMVHYNGYCKLRVTRPEDTLQQAMAIAEDAGGYVESLTATAVTIRVPVQVFRDIFAAALKLGDVVSRAITAQDVTDAYTAVALRLKTLRTSRDRLIELLARARNEQEKLTILREIRRLTEEVDRLEMNLKTIAALASFSRITIEAEARHVDRSSHSEETVGAFSWIHGMSPFRRDMAHQQEKLEFSSPQGMVELDTDDHWIAESADGAVMWSHRRENRPQGSTDYWADAIVSRLKSDFAESKVEAFGSFKVVRMVDAGSTAYRYLIAVRATDDELDIVEVHYPTADHEARYGAAVRAIITAGGES